MRAFPVGERELEEGQSLVARHEALHRVGEVEELVAATHATATARATSVQTPSAAKITSAADPHAVQRDDALEGPSAVGGEERDRDERERGGQEDLEGLVQLRFEVRRLDLGEVAELADEHDDEGRRDLLPARRTLLDVGLARALLLLDGLGHDEQVRRAAEEEHADDQVLPVHRDEREERPRADRESHLDRKGARRAEHDHQRSSTRAHDHLRQERLVGQLEDEHEGDDAQERPNVHEVRRTAGASPRRR